MRSDPTAEPRRIAGASTIVGIALALMVMSVLAAWLIASRGGPIDGAAQLESAFGVRTIGPAYAIVEARKVANGARYVALADEEASSEPEQVKAAPAPGMPGPPSSDGGSPNPPEDRVDWSRVTIPATTTRPRRVAFLFPDEDAKHAIVDEFFRNVERTSLLDLGPEGGKVTIASDKLAWRGFDATWVHERVFEKGGTFRDAMRVDLSVEDRACVMTAEWTRGEPATRAALDALLAALDAG
jgi:hypothetical protein